MGVTEMTHVSYFFIVMAVALGSVSVIMYFTLDIRGCWRIVRGTHSVAVRETVPFIINPNTEGNGGGQILEKTEKLVLDKTETLETMTLVQDIVMMTNIVVDVDKIR